MIIFLYGPDGYRLRQNSKIVLDNYRKKHPSGAFLKFDFGNGAELSSVEDSIKSGSLFAEVKLIVIKDIFSQKVDSNRVEELIKKHCLTKEKDVVLLFLEDKAGKELLTKDKVLFNLLINKDNVVRNFEYLQGEKLSKWIKNEFLLRGCSVDNESVRELLGVVGNDSWDLINEINKLSNFAKEVKKEDVATLAAKKTDLNIFDLVDAVAGKDKPKAYEILFKEVDSGRDPYYLLTMMVYSFRNLLAVKDLADRGMPLEAITKKARLHPFVARKTYHSANKFHLEELKLKYNQLLEMDTGSKEGRVNLSDSLFSFVLN